MEQTNKKASILTIILTILLGMSVTLVRVVMPTHVEITAGIVILEGLLEMGICIAVIWLNRKALKEAFQKKFVKIDFLKIIICWVIVSILERVILLLVFSIFYLRTGALPTGFQDPAATVGEAFLNIFPIGVTITQCLTAPIWEEIVFRMTFKNAIQPFKNPIINNVLFILISSLLFGFLHTASFLTLGILDYFIFGCLFACVYLKTKDIRINIFAHMLYNILIFVIPLVTGLFS